MLLLLLVARELDIKTELKLAHKGYFKIIDEGFFYH